MPQQQITLDRATVAGLKLDAGKTDQIVFDADMKGFGFRMRRDGVRQRQSWIVQYRIKGRTRRFRIGDYPTINADQARKRAKTVLANVHLGADPQAEKEAERANGSRTLRSVADQYLEMKELEMQRGQYRASSLRDENLSYAPAVFRAAALTRHHRHYGRGHRGAPELHQPQ